MTDKTREDFEAWAKVVGWPHHAKNTNDTDCYLDQSWAGYQVATQQSAARIAALEAEVLALRKDAAKASDLQSLIDWMVPNHDLVYHAIGATGAGFVERVREYIAHDAVRPAIEAERGEG